VESLATNRANHRLVASSIMLISKISSPRPSNRIMVGIGPLDEIKWISFARAESPTRRAGGRGARGASDEFSRREAGRAGFGNQTFSVMFGDYIAVKRSAG
jgi:hypothetical protein